MSEAYVDLPHHVISPRTTNLVRSLCHTLGSNNLSLHHSLDSLSSPIDYILKSLDKCVMFIINILSSSKVAIGFLMRNAILALDDLCCRRPLIAFLQHKPVRVLYYTLSSLLSSICSSWPWSITIFYVKNVMRITPPLKNSWYNWYLSPSPFIS